MGKTTAMPPPAAVVDARDTGSLIIIKNTFFLKMNTFPITLILSYYEQRDSNS